MKTFLLTIGLTLSLISCDSYQDAAKDLGAADPTVIRVGAGAGDIQDETDNENSLSENMQIFLDNFLVPLNNSTQDTLFDYDSLYSQRDDIEVVQLRRNILTQLAKTNFDELSKNEKIAFLINAYNFLAVHTVVTNYILPDGSKLASIIDIGGAGSFSAFSSITYNISGKQMSLDDIEKGTLKPLLTHSTSPLKIDARFHFAVICAAKGCPILIKEAYRANEINSQLEEATKSGLDLPRNFEQTESHLRVSNLFEWYKEDFENHAISGSENVTGSNKNFLKIYQPEIDLSLPTQTIEYDWALNNGSRE